MFFFQHGDTKTIKYTDRGLMGTDKGVDWLQVEGGGRGEYGEKGGTTVTEQ